MGRGLKRVALAASTTFTLAAALLVGTASAAGADPLPDLSSRAAIEQYLVSIGVDPATAVWQTGLKNYAGPGCPGLGWNCVRANAPIVQIAAPLGTNQYACTGPECVAVQVVPQGGQNDAMCVEDDKHQVPARQDCDVTQLIEEGNPNNSNTATITQSIQQSTGPDQLARQIARISQMNGVGNNIAGIHQTITQTQSARSSAPLDQTQHAYQAATVNQTTETGKNTSNIGQHQKQSQKASGASATQNQNVEPSPPEGDPTCDQPSESGPFQDKNQCAFVDQLSSLIDGGVNRSNLGQDIAQGQTVSNSPSATQTQGTIGCPPCSGQQGDVLQDSSAPVFSEANQDTVQVQTARGVPEAATTQSQTVGDPRCCATQTINSGSMADIKQRTNQSASSEEADQSAVFSGNCESSGSCHVFQSATIDGDSDTNECDDVAGDGPASCQEFLFCQEVMDEESGTTETQCFED